VAGVATAQEYATIVVGGEVVARIRTGGPHGDVYQRQAKIDQRITNALSYELSNIFDEEKGGPDLDVYQSGGLWTLSIGDTMLIQAYHEDAVGSGVSTRELIYQWKENFAEQLPRAVPPPKVPQWWKEAHPDNGPDVVKRPHGLDPPDAPLVREIVQILDAARQMPEPQFERLNGAIERSMIERIWDYRRPGCGAPPAGEHIRVSAALKRVRAVDQQKYEAEKWWMAGIMIRRLREAFSIPAGTGPIPEQRPLPDFEALPQPTTPPVQPVPQPVVDSPVRRVLLGTGLGANNELLNAGTQFEPEVRQLIVYFEIEGGAPNTIVGVSIRKGTDILARRLLRVGGNKRLAVTFYPARSTSFSRGQYLCAVTVNGQQTHAIPFQVGAGTETIIEG